MRTVAALVTIAALAGSIGVALAQSSNLHSGPAISTEAMKQKLNALGYDVRRLQAHGGVFKAHIVERRSGGAVKASFDLATGELIQAAPAR